jgi:hypothetical protein
MFHLGRPKEAAVGVKRYVQLQRIKRIRKLIIGMDPEAGVIGN